VIVDIHAHLAPASSTARFPLPPSLTDVEGMLAARDEAGIELTIIGSPVGAGAMMRVPGVDNYRQSRDQLRAFHDWKASLVERYPDRLRSYVYANPLGNDDHLEGVRETLENPAFVGLMINSSVRGRLLDDPAADSFFALVAETGKPVIVHPPAEPIGSQEIDDFGFVEHVSRFCDVTAGLAMLAFKGWLDKYPTLTVIGAGGGGAVGALFDKLDLAARSRPGPPRAAGPRPAERRPGQTLRRIYVDTATPSPDHLAMNVNAFGSGNLMLGTDSPPMPVCPRSIVDAVRALPISATEREAILGGTAVRLFGLGAASTSQKEASSAAG
jgi:aminocarboxymuconate-semialdehyde decarboxylase